jgi:dTDP-4-amino-4,6-dideoxygalactose transaminase
LALQGGPRAVRGAYQERWQLRWWQVGLQIAKHIKWGVVTAAGGGRITQFERAFANLTGCEFALAMNSGTAALHSALFAVGVRPDDEVIVPTYTWHATASAVLCCGARPIFCDIDPRTLTACPRDIEKRITPRTRAIMVVHIWGNPAELDAILAVANRHDLPVIEDCSHAHGATYQGKPVGAWGEIGCFSLQGGKAVSAGEGGIAVCNRREYYERMLALGHPIRAGEEATNHALSLGNIHLGPKYRPHLFGVLLAQSNLQRLEQLNTLRQRNWQFLCDELAACPGVLPIETLPTAKRGGFLEYKFILDLEWLQGTRDTFIQAAQAEGVPVTPERYRFLHENLVFRKGGPITLDLLSISPESLPPLAELPGAESVQDRIIALPAFAEVSEIFVRQCARGMRKVAVAMRRATDRGRPS